MKIKIKNIKFRWLTKEERKKHPLSINVEKIKGSEKNDRKENK